MRLRKDAKVELLKRVPLFAQCSRRELAEVASLADELDVPAGKELTTQGQPGREFVVLVEGEAEVRKNGRKVATLSDGDFFGELALVTSRPRNATVVARTPARVLVLTERSFRTLLDHSPSIRQKVLAALAVRLDDEL